MEVGNDGSGCSYPKGCVAEPAVSYGYRWLQGILILQLLKKVFAHRYQVFCHSSLQKLILEHQMGSIPSQTARHADLQLESMCLSAFLLLGKLSPSRSGAPAALPGLPNVAISVQKGPGASCTILT